MSDDGTDPHAIGKKNLRPGFLGDPEKAREAARKSHEVQRRKRLATRKPKELADDALVGLVLVRDRLRRRLEAMPESDPRSLDIEKLLADLEVRLLDRVAGKPAIVRPSESGSPEDYRTVLESFPEGSAPAAVEDAAP